MGAVQRLMRETVINDAAFESESLVRMSRLKATNFLPYEPLLEVRVSVRPFLGSAVPPRLGVGRSCGTREERRPQERWDAVPAPRRGGTLCALQNSDYNTLSLKPRGPQDFVGCVCVCV